MHIPSRISSVAEKVTDVNDTASPFGPTAAMSIVPFARVGQFATQS